MVVDGPPCDSPDRSSRWSGIRVSPDGSRALAVRHQHVELIDLASGSAMPLGDDLTEASWSPDGKWIAANETKGEQTVLLDAQTLMRRKRLNQTWLEWSPDSRYLLARVRSMKCGLFSEIGTLEMVDVQTGRGTGVNSSSCLVDRVTTGWVSREIAH